MVIRSEKRTKTSFSFVYDHRLARLPVRRVTARAPRSDCCLALRCGWGSLWLSAQLLGVANQVFDRIGGGGVNWSDKLNWQSGRISWPVCRRLRKYSNRLIFRRRIMSVALGSAERLRYSSAQTGTANDG